MRGLLRCSSIGAAPLYSPPNPLSVSFLCSCCCSRHCLHGRQDMEEGGEEGGEEEKLHEHDRAPNFNLFPHSSLPSFSLFSSLLSSLSAPAPRRMAFLTRCWTEGLHPSRQKVARPEEAGGR